VPGPVGPFGYQNKEIACERRGTRILVQEAGFAAGKTQLPSRTATTGAYKRHWGAYGRPPSDDLGVVRSLLLDADQLERGATVADCLFWRT